MSTAWEIAKQRRPAEYQQLETLTAALLALCKAEQEAADATAKVYAALGTGTHGDAVQHMQQAKQRAEQQHRKYTQQRLELVGSTN